MAQVAHADPHVCEARMESLGLLFGRVGDFCFSGFGWLLVGGYKWPMWGVVGSGNGEHVAKGRRMTP